jgi:hypothetical protein
MYAGSARNKLFYLDKDALRVLTFPTSIPDGAVAQLGARLTGSQEVGGSNPPSSTKDYKGLRLRS